jgi:curved DNA-binding protein CbpA
MNDLLNSYAILQPTLGTSMVLINQCYRRLVMSWHPDKFRGEEAKATAERELKKINIM